MLIIRITVKKAITVIEKTKYGALRRSPRLQADAAGSIKRTRTLAGTLVGSGMESGGERKA